MMLVELTSVPTASLPIAALKAHLRLGSGFESDDAHDTGLETYLRAALAAIEARTGKILIEREFRWELREWRDPVRQPLPLAPVNAIVSVTRFGVATPPEEVARARYALESDAQRPTLHATGAALPRVPQGGRIEVVLMAGFGPEWTDLPADLAQAVMLLAAHFYEYRIGGDARDTSLPQGVAALIERYRTVRLFMGGRT
ncbi:hypothetical protein AN189_04460 [Loktanella sp. 3ANDIMAR09]|uniref:head-tail connector protein n=1 Tax=Loktanella sp. 3ANDIMAR09 TaxID=1225657 RepID=UPI0006F38359|nr:head-tail connector protein [Loktanella sp. 3ANDIMAR09]KQI69814.1 hypothetical protein AN189_04460 [Loktanella sp. 3ANDIMAR09]